MNCCLWFNRCRISSAAEISENMDIAALRGYFLGGSLIQWLREHDGAAYADKLEQIDPADPELNKKLVAVFIEQPQPAPQKEIFCGNTAAAECCAAGGNGSFGSFGSFGSLGSWRFGSWSGLSALGSFKGGSFGTGSYRFGSFGSFSQFRMWEWEWEWRFGGSFRGSFRGIGSFGGSFGLGGSFGMLGFGSYVFGSGAYLLGSYRGGVPGSFGGSCMTGGSGWQMTAQEYDRIMYECLRRCPLDCFGYGIHIV